MVSTYMQTQTNVIQQLLLSTLGDTLVVPLSSLLVLMRTMVKM